MATFFHSRSAKATGLLDEEETVHATGHAVRSEGDKRPHLQGQLVLYAEYDRDHLDRLLGELPGRTFDYRGTTYLPSGEAVPESDHRVVVRAVHLNEYAGTITVVFEGS